MAGRGRVMKLNVMVIVAMLLPAVQVGAEEPQTIKTQKEMLNYSIGAEFGKSLKNQGVEVDLDVLLKGLKNGLSGESLLMSEKEIRKTIVEFQLGQKFKRSVMKKASPEENKKKSESFLADNGTKAGVVTLPSGMQYKILKAGDGRKPTDTDTVVCYHRGALIDGLEFDSSYQSGQPATFKVSEAVYPALGEALKLMPAGSKWQFFIPSQLAYGEQGNGRGIGPNETLIYEIELLAVK